MAELIGLNGDKQGKTIALEKELTRFGRASDNDIVLEDGSVSAAHCLIRKESRGYVILDLESSNGTRLNEEDIREKVLTHRDMIAMGNQLFRFVDLEEQVEDRASVKPVVKNESTPPDGKQNSEPEVSPRRGVKSRDEGKKKGAVRQVQANRVAERASTVEDQGPLTLKKPAYTVIGISAIGLMTFMMIVYVHLVMK